MGIAFGTEGWRAVIAEDFTFDNVRTVTQAVAEHVHRRGRAGTLTIGVGYDTRFLSRRFAQAVCEVLAGNGLRSLLTRDAIPTPAVSRFVVERRLTAGIMVTASHNPGIYNGLKVKEAFGGSATAETVASIERRLGRGTVRRVAFEDAEAQGWVRTVEMLPPFLRGIRSFVDLAAIRRSRLRVIADPMHGAAGRLIERLLHGGRCRVETIRAERDPLFGGEAPEPIASHLQPLRRRVRQARADLGIANDGDADRLGIVGPDGEWLNPGQILCVLLAHLVTARGLRGAVVKTVSNTTMIDRMTHALGVRLIEVPVGFKYVAAHMLKGGVLLGGEESGGIGISAYLPERDGILNGLLLLEALAVQRRSLPALLGRLTRRYGRWAYGRRDLRLKPVQVDGLFRRLERQPPGRLPGGPVVRVNRLDGIKLIGRDESWLLFRRSGTEPLVRIYAETPRASRLAALLSFGVRLATQT